MAATSITRRIEFDSGHRIPDHKSKCKSLHGHRYVLEATVEGHVIDAPGTSDHGMIVDFGNLKDIMTRAVGDVWDHAFLVWDRDDRLVDFLDESHADEGTRYIILPVVPTVENLALNAWHHIVDYMKREGLRANLVHVRLYETPNCWADVRAGDPS